LSNNKNSRGGDELSEKGTTVTIVLTPEYIKRLKQFALDEGMTIKAVITKWIEENTK
jgi:hypothetical protein